MKEHEAIRVLRRYATKERAVNNARFFKTGKGEYGEGDRFFGVVVPDIRKVAKQFCDLPLAQVQELLASELHEVRLLALIIWTLQFQKADVGEQEKIYRTYLASTKYINNWDLVDVTAPRNVGAWLCNHDRSVLYRMARSRLLWDRRIAIISTFAFLPAKDCSTTLEIADILLHDDHDLMQKAVGWALREVGKRCGADVLREFLRPRYQGMPRTALRYAIEHFSPVERKRWLLGKV